MQKKIPQTNCKHDSYYVIIGVLAVSLISAFFVLLRQNIVTQSIISQQKQIITAQNTVLKTTPVESNLDVSVPATSEVTFVPVLGIPSCVDTDGGDNTGVKGTSRACEGDRCTTAYESCKIVGGVSKYVEQFCNNTHETSGITTREGVCDLGTSCQAGACIKTRCTDSDTGGTNQQWVYGMAKDETGNQITDTCSTSPDQPGKIKEAYCSNNNTASVKEMSCETADGIVGMCRDGRCMYSCANGRMCPKGFECSPEAQCVPKECESSTDCPGQNFQCVDGHCKLSYELSCLDTDPLNNPYRIGSVTYNSETASGLEQTDKCDPSNNKKVTEFFCQEGQTTAQTLTRDCPNNVDQTGKKTQSVCTMKNDYKRGISGGKCIFMCNDQNDKSCPKDMNCVEGECVAPEPCKGREDCENNEQCISGKCVAQVTQYCEKTTDCQNGLICYNNKCVPPTCKNNNECGEGLICYMNQCVECLNNSTCASTQEPICYKNSCVECTNNSQCPKMAICNITTHKCESTEKCTNASDCEQGEICKNGTCVKLEAESCKDTDYDSKTQSDDLTKRGTLYLEGQQPKMDACTKEDGSLATNDMGVSVRQYNCSTPEKMNIGYFSVCNGATSCKTGACICTDTDSSNDPLVAGQVNATNKTSAINDECLGGTDNVVIEYSCNSDQSARPSIRTCPEGTTCKDGACSK